VNASSDMYAAASLRHRDDALDPPPLLLPLIRCYSSSLAALACSVLPKRRSRLYREAPVGVLPCDLIVMARKDDDVLRRMMCTLLHRRLRLCFD